MGTLIFFPRQKLPTFIDKPKREAMPGILSGTVGCLMPGLGVLEHFKKPERAGSIQPLRQQMGTLQGRLSYAWD